MKKKNSLLKVSVESFNINGETVRVKIVRDSKICRLLTDEDHITIGHTIYVRGKLLVQRIIRDGLREMNKAPLWKTKLFNILQN